VKSKTKLTPEITQVLSRGGVIDITTNGAKSGKPRRIEIVFHRIDGRMWISGMPSPRRRSWRSMLRRSSIARPARP